MATYQIYRPPIDPDTRKELQQYLLTQYENAHSIRREQVEDKYTRWDRNYNAYPKEKVRTVPYYKSSNIVVPIIRIYVDTYVARTLTIMFATRPLFNIDGYPREVKEAYESYVNRKARYDWGYYNLVSQLLSRGAKNGTVVAKTIHDKTTRIWADEKQEREVVVFEGPKTMVIPFEDFCVYPTTANDLRQVQIKFHRIRYTEEEILRIIEEDADALKWDITKEDLERIVSKPKDDKRLQQQEDAGISDPHLKEVHFEECHLDYPIGNTGKYYSIVALLCPALNRLIDVYVTPYPPGVDIFHDYRPKPKEDFFWGDSWCQILDAAQEEASQIHNARRDSAILATGPMWKRKNGARVPNPSTNSYPGKVFELDEMDDLELLQVSAQIGDMMQEEAMVYQLADRLAGFSPEMQGLSQGNSGKRGIYNTGGVLAVMAEGNLRQDSNIRDVREVVSCIIKSAVSIQARFSPDDPAINFFDPAEQNNIRQALALSTDIERTRFTKFETNVSDAGANKEVEKAALLQMSNTVGQYAQTIQQLMPQVLSMQNPVLKAILYRIVSMQAWMVKRLAYVYEEYDAEGPLNDLKSAIDAGVPELQGGSSGGTTGPTPPSLAGGNTQGLQSPGPTNATGGSPPPILSAGMGVGGSLPGGPPGAGMGM